MVIMGRETIILWVFLLALCIPISLGATLHGNVYDYTLDIVKNAIVQVDSVPEQTYVAKDGTYSFTLNLGDYTIKAAYQDRDNKYTFEQNITILDEGDYVFDIILFPDIDNELMDEETDIPNIYGDELSIYWWQIIILVVIILAVVLVIIFSKKKKKNIDIEEDKADEVLAFIKKQGGRVTQKDIRKEFPVSEAKVSLVITELEDKSLLKKIKRGRGNIVILERK